MTTLPSTHAASIRRPWSGGARARGIGAEISADLRAELVRSNACRRLTASRRCASRSLRMPQQWSWSLRQPGRLL